MTATPIRHIYIRTAAPRNPALGPAGCIEGTVRMDIVCAIMNISMLKKF